MFEQELLQIIKQAAMEAVQAGKPADVRIGTVISEKPLKIRLSQQAEYDEDFFILSRSMTDYRVSVTVPQRESTAEDGSTVALKKEKLDLTIHNALKEGEKVLLVQQSGGQQFVVLDRVVK